MKEILPDVERWHARGERVVAARVVAVEGSGPRDPGAAMAVNEAGDVAGSVSGGCVEGAVVTEALAVLSGDAPDRRLVTFGYSDDEAFAVGLTCGGTIHVFVEPFDWWWEDDLSADLREAMASGAQAALVTEISGDSPGAKLLARPGTAPLGTLGHPELDRVAARDALGDLDSGRSTVRHYGRRGEARRNDVAVFVQSFLPPPRLVIFGAVDFTAALARAGSFLGFQVTVCDPREAFATPERFPMADAVVVDWPQRYLASAELELGARDAVCVLTHDEKFDIPAIVAALETDVGYVGAMGSRRTHERRLQRLRQAGVDEDDLEQRLMSPIGIDIGGRTPEEVAISICAEIVALRTGHPVPHLRDVDGAVHDPDRRRR